MIRNGTRVQDRNGDFHSVQSLVDQVETGIKNTTKFIVEKTKEFSSGYQDYLLENQYQMLVVVQEQMLGEFF